MLPVARAPADLLPVPRRSLCVVTDGYISPYAWTLLCIFYLQTSPFFCLPSLQAEAAAQELAEGPWMPRPQTRRNDGAAFDCHFAAPTPEAQARAQASTPTLGQLVSGFFFHCAPPRPLAPRPAEERCVADRPRMHRADARFDFGYSLVSVRAGTACARTEAWRDSLFAIEDPFELQLDLGGSPC